MAGNKDLKFSLSADVAKAQQSLKDVAKGAQEAGDAIEELESPAKSAAAAVAAAADEITAEMERTQDVVRKLSDALGPEMSAAIGRADLTRMATDLRRAGVEADDLDADVDQLADSLKRLSVASGKIDIDESGNVRRIRTDLDDASDAAGRAQTGIGTLRGVTDELGGSAGQVGIWGSAMVDAGETVELFGSKLGLSQDAATKFSAGLGTFAVAATAAVAAGTAAWSAYNKKQEETAKKTADATEAMADQLGVLDRLREAAGVGAEEFSDFGAAFTASVIDAMDDGDVRRTSGALRDLGLTVKDLGPALLEIERNSQGAMAQLAVDAGVPAELAAGLAKAVDVGEDWNDIRQNLISADWSDAQIEQYKSVALALEELNDQQQNYDADTIAEGLLDQIAAADDASAAMVRKAEATAEAADADATAADVLDEVIRLQAEAGEETSLTASQMVTAAREADKLASAYDAAADAAAKQKRETIEQADALGDLYGVLDREDAAADLEQSFDDLRGSIEDAYTAGVEGAEDAADKGAAYQQQMRDTKRDVIEYAFEVLKLPPERITAIIAQIDNGEIDQVEADLAWLTRTRNAYINVSSNYSNAGGVGGGQFFFNAKGGRYNKPTLAMIGETYDDEIVLNLDDPQASAQILSQPGVMPKLIRSLAAGGVQMMASGGIATRGALPVNGRVPELRGIALSDALNTVFAAMVDKIEEPGGELVLTDEDGPEAPVRVRHHKQGAAL